MFIMLDVLFYEARRAAALGLLTDFRVCDEATLYLVKLLPV